MLSQLFPSTQVDLDAGSFAAAAGARDAARRAKWGARFVAPFCVVQPSDAGREAVQCASCCWISRVAALVAVGRFRCGVLVFVVLSVAADYR